MIRIASLEIECGACEARETIPVPPRQTMTKTAVNAGWCKVLGQWQCPCCLVNAREAFSGQPLPATRDMEASNG